MDETVPAEIVEELRRLVPDFRRAYEPDGLSVGEFDTFGATVRTLRTFIASYHDLAETVREFMLPNPDEVSRPSTPRRWLQSGPWGGVASR
jgi:transaldolase